MEAALDAAGYPEICLDSFSGIGIRQVSSAFMICLCNEVGQSYRSM